MFIDSALSVSSQARAYCRQIGLDHDGPYGRTTHCPRPSPRFATTSSPPVTAVRNSVVPARHRGSQRRRPRPSPRFATTSSPPVTAVRNDVVFARHRGSQRRRSRPSPRFATTSSSPVTAVRNDVVPARHRGSQANCCSDSGPSGIREDPN
jgi:hypothetical protein